jgi:Nucleoside-diphosphate-sugar epimerases
MDCLLFGGGGFIGSHLCSRLLRDGHRVKIFERKGFIPKIVSPQLDYIIGDFTNPDSYKRYIKQVDIVFHLISTTTSEMSNQDPTFDISSNVIATIHLLEEIRTNNVKKVVFFSSGGTVYGNSVTVPIKEDQPTDPICSYGIHKLAIEKYLYLYNFLYGLDYSIIRLSNPFGKNGGKNGQGVVSVFIKKITMNQPIEVWGDGLVIRDYIYIEDVIDAVMLLLTYQGHYKVFNISSGKGLNLLEVIRAIAEVLERPCGINFLAGRKADVSVNVLDNSRACRELGWSPKFTFKQGLRRMLNDEFYQQKAGQETPR